MDITFCDNIYINKRIIKFIPLIEKICYVFIGNYKDRFILEYIKRDYTKKDPFENVYKVKNSDVKIINLYNYLTNEKYEGDDLTKIKKEILDILFFKDYESIFIEEIIYNDDTNEKILMKISEYCYNDNKPPIKHLLAMYKCNDIFQSLTIEYLHGGIPKNMKDMKPCDLIDKIMINENGDQKRVEKKNVIYNLFEMNKMDDNIIRYISIKEYLDFKSIFNELQNNNNIDDCDIKSFYNGMIYKYWPKINFNEIIKYNEEENIEKRLIQRENELKILNQYSIGCKLINKRINNTIKCSSFDITYMRLIKKSDTINNINISKLFNDSILNENIPFIKLILGSHNEKYFKLYKNSIIYNGLEKDLNENQVIDKDLCREWSEDYYIDSKYKNNVEFIHPNNIIIFKIYNDVNKHLYCSLIIHINGDIECIIKQRKNKDRYEIKTYIQTKNDIIELLKMCNTLIEKLNILQNISLYDIEKFGDEDELHNIFENKGKIKVDFLNCNILFDKNEHIVINGIDSKDIKREYTDKFSPFKVGNKLPNWVNLIGNLFNKLPMFFRMKVEEKENSRGNDRIIGHYNRVNNYFNISTIHSTISAYSNIYEPEEIISKISKEFGKPIDEMKVEYELWNETNKIREQNKKNLNQSNINQYNLIVEEEGPDINIYKKSSEIYLNINITNVKSFNELYRIINVIRSIIDLYDNYINNKLSSRMKKLFEDNEMVEYDPNINDSDDSDSDIDEGDKERMLDLVDILDSDSDGLELSDLSSDEESSQGGGGKNTIKSYHIKRL